MDADPASFLELINTSLLFGVLGIIVLLFFSAMASGAEVALFSLSQKNIEDAIEQNENQNYYSGEFSNVKLYEFRKI